MKARSRPPGAKSQVVKASLRLPKIVSAQVQPFSEISVRMNAFCNLFGAASVCLFVSSAALAEEQEFAGNYQLVSATRKILDTGQIEETYGKKPKGLAMYGKDGHFVILITYDGRPKPESIDKMTDRQRADLHRMMTAYGGTYTYDGSKVAHHLDLSWNEVWAGTTNIRDVQRDGDRRRDVGLGKNEIAARAFE